MAQASPRGAKNATSVTLFCCLHMGTGATVLGTEIMSTTRRHAVPTAAPVTRRGKLTTQNVLPLG